MKFCLTIRGEAAEKKVAEWAARARRQEEALSRPHERTCFEAQEGAFVYKTDVARVSVKADRDQVVISYSGRRVSMTASPAVNFLLGWMLHLEEEGEVSLEVSEYTSSEPDWLWWRTSATDRLGRPERISRVLPQCLGAEFFVDGMPPTKEDMAVAVYIPYSPRSFEGIVRDTLAYLGDGDFVPVALVKEGEQGPDGYCHLTVDRFGQVPGSRAQPRDIAVVNGGPTELGFAAATLRVDRHLNVQPDGVTLLGAQPCREGFGKGDFEAVDGL